MRIIFHCRDRTDCRQPDTPAPTLAIILPSRGPSFMIRRRQAPARCPFRPAYTDRRMSTSALLTDLYQLTMVQAYLEEDLLDEAVFSLFVRRMPEGRNYLLACGLDDVLRYLEQLHFDSESLDYLESL